MIVRSPAFLFGLAVAAATLLIAQEVRAELYPTLAWADTGKKAWVILIGWR